MLSNHRSTPHIGRRGQYSGAAIFIDTFALCGHLTWRLSCQESTREC
jgi:hypothetical protein